MSVRACNPSRRGNRRADSRLPMCIGTVFFFRNVLPTEHNPTIIVFAPMRSLLNVYALFSKINFLCFLALKYVSECYESLWE